MLNGITVAERPGEDGQPKYVLVCGEGRLNAFRILGETHIPALVVDVSDEDAFIMSLAENIARRGYRPLEILADIELLCNRGYSADVIIQKTGLSPKYVRDKTSPIEQIVKLEREMSQVQTQYKDAEQNYGSDLLNLVVAKGYLTKLLSNEAVNSYIQRHEPEILEQFELVVNTVSMEEAVQQQTETTSADVSEASEP